MEIKEFFKIKIKFKRSESPIKTQKSCCILFWSFKSNTSDENMSVSYIVLVQVSARITVDVKQRL